jgi:hypothetical protein
MVSDPQVNKFRVIAQDPTVKHNQRILTTEVSIPKEELQIGPRGYRVSVVDYDSTRRTFYEPADLGDGSKFNTAPDDVLINNPCFHAQNVYAITMRTLSRFEFALGRRIPWAFYGHQLMIAPHAIQDANAFYSERDHGLFFGYFLGKDDNIVFTCLSHDIIAHETAHALLDGLRDHYTDPSRADQAAYHEGFSDIVALLSVFSLKDVVKAIVGSASNQGQNRSVLTADWLKKSALLGLAEEMGKELSLSGLRRDALRRSAMMTPDPSLLDTREYQECHLRGEIFVAAVLNAFTHVWEKRLTPFNDPVPFERVSEEGASAAEHLLNISIRALDYCPPVDIDFSDVLSAILTADWELVPNDSKYGYRNLLRTGFKDWGITPASKKKENVEEGIWLKPEIETNKPLNYDNVHFESLKRDPDEIHRFLWDNRDKLGVFEWAFTKVNWVRPCIRVGPDGFVLHETIAEYIQMIDLEAKDLHVLELKKPEDMPEDVLIRLYGGGTLIFDEFGRLKYHVHKHIDNTDRQQKKIDYMWDTGMLDRYNRIGVSKPVPPSEQFALWHRLRLGGFTGGV